MPREPSLGILIAMRRDIPQHGRCSQQRPPPRSPRAGNSQETVCKGATVDTLITARRDVPFRSATACRAALSLRAVSRMMGRRRAMEVGRGERRGLWSVFGMAFCGPRGEGGPPRGGRGPFRHV